MKCLIILGVISAMALLAPSAHAAPVEAEDLAAAVEPADAQEPIIEVVDEADLSGSDESADPKVEISNDYYIDVKDHPPKTPPWWW